MRVLLVIGDYFPVWGGTENQARSQAEELVRLGHEVTVATWRRNRAWPAREVIGGVVVRRADRESRSVWPAIRSVAGMSRILATEVRRSDVVIAHQILFIAYLAALIGCLTRTPCVVKAASTARCTNSDLNRLARRGLRSRMLRLLATTIRWGGVAVATTNEIEADLGRLGFRRVVRISNGVIAPEDRGNDLGRREVRRTLGLPEATKLVVATGRLTWWKGFDILLRSWPHVAHSMPGARLVLIGGGPDLADLKRLVADLGIGSSVYFLPASDRATEYVSAADVVVIPSRFEGLSNALLEAMAAGVPVVCTRVSGAVDLIRDGENGRLVPVEDHRALADAIREILIDPGEMGRLARATVLPRCEMHYIVGLYERLLAHAAAIPRGVTLGADLPAYNSDSMSEAS